MPRVIEEALPNSVTPKTRAYLRAILAEGVATFFFVAAVLSSLINQTRSGDGPVNVPIGTGIVVALVGTVTVFAFGDISGAHFNPSITLGFLLARKIGIFKGISYIVAQFIGGIVAAGLVYSWFPSDLEGFPSVSDIIPPTVPQNVPVWNAFFMETYLVFNLVYVVFATAVDRIPPPDLVKVDQDYAVIRNQYKTERVGLSEGVVLNPTDPTTEELEAQVEAEDNERALDVENPRQAGPLGTRRTTTTTTTTTGARSDKDSDMGIEEFKERILVFVQPGATKRNFAPIAIGFTLGFNAFLGSSSSGGAFNPARALGSQIFSGVWSDGWIYYVGPILGALIAVLIHQLLLARTGAFLSPPRVVVDSTDNPKTTTTTTTTPASTEPLTDEERKRQAEEIERQHIAEDMKNKKREQNKISRFFNRNKENNPATNVD